MPTGALRPEGGRAWAWGTGIAERCGISIIGVLLDLNQTKAIQSSVGDGLILCLKKE